MGHRVLHRLVGSVPDRECAVVEAKGNIPSAGVIWDSCAFFRVSAFSATFDNSFFMTMMVQDDEKCIQIQSSGLIG